MTQELSNCCNAKVTVSTGNEGTSCYICSNCQKACDVHAEKSPIEKKGYSNRMMTSIGKKL